MVATDNPPAPVINNPQQFATDDRVTKPKEDASGKWLSPEPIWITAVNSEVNPEIASAQDLETEPRRRLVLCFDGTGDRYGKQNSNVVKLVGLMQKHDPTKQMIYYRTGIGTETEADALLSFIQQASTLLDLMFAFTLHRHVKQGYEFLCQHYKRGDVICIFGFSRGAYTARALAGMVQKVGILPPGNMGLIPFAYQMYVSTDPEMNELAPGFKKTFSADVKIEFVGVWDTVKSVGLIKRRNLPFANSVWSVHYFRHALALDEHRVKFMPSFISLRGHEDCEVEPEAGIEVNQDDGLVQWILYRLLAWGILGPLSILILGMLSLPVILFQSVVGKRNPAVEHDQNNNSDDDNNEDDDYGRELAKSGRNVGTNFQEVWFAGSHCDVGGGATPNSTRHSLSRISLRWMIRECFRCNTGIIFDAKALRDEVGINVDIESKPPKLNPIPQRRKLSPLDKIETRQAQQPIHGSDVFRQLIHTVIYLFYFLAKKIVSTATSRFNREPGHKKPIKLTQEASEEVKEIDEAKEELFDALSPINDELERVPLWWLLEYFPLTVQHHSGKELIYMGLGQGRNAFWSAAQKGMYVHRSVKTRLRAKDKDGGTYVPNVRLISKGDNDGAEESKQSRLHRPMSHQEWLNLTRKPKKQPKGDPLSMLWFS